MRGAVCWHGPLLRGFIEQYAGGDGGVEAFDGAWAGNSDGAIGQSRNFLGHAVALIADEEGGGVSEADAIGGRSGSCRGDEGFDSSCAQVGEGAFRGCGDDRHAEDAAGRGADGFGVPGADGSGQANDAVGAEGFSGTQDRSKVAGILEAGEDQEQRRRALGDAEDLSPGPIGRIDERCHGLRRFGGQDGTEQVLGKEQNLGAWRQGVFLFAGQFFRRDEDAVNTQACADGLVEEVRPFNAGRSPADRCDEGAPQFSYPAILLTLYNTKRHCGLVRVSMQILCCLSPQL